MTKMLKISDELATALEAKRLQAGLSSIDDAAEVLLRDALSSGAQDLDDLGLTEDALRALILEGDASGPTAPWDAKAVSDEVLSRYKQAPRG